MRSREDVRGGTIRPGVGFGVVDLGESGEKVRRVLGPPARTFAFDRVAMLDYRDTLGVDFLVAGAGERVVEIRFNEHYRGRTTDGIGIGDPFDRALAASGGAKTTVAVAYAETQGGPRHGTDRVL